LAVVSERAAPMGGGAIEDFVAANRLA